MQNFSISFSLLPAVISNVFSRFFSSSISMLTSPLLFHEVSWFVITYIDRSTRFLKIESISNNNGRWRGVETYLRWLYTRRGSLLRVSWSFQASWCMFQARQKTSPFLFLSSVFSLTLVFFLMFSSLHVALRMRRRRGEILACCGTWARFFKCCLKTPAPRWNSRAPVTSFRKKKILTVCYN